MPTAYSATISNFVGHKDAGASISELERLRMLTMYERREHRNNDQRFDGTITPDGGILRRCRGGVSRDSINRFGQYQMTEVTAAIRKVHSIL